MKRIPIDLIPWCALVGVALAVVCAVEAGR